MGKPRSNASAVKIRRPKTSWLSEQQIVDRIAKIDAYLTSLAEQIEEVKQEREDHQVLLTQIRKRAARQQKGKPIPEAKPA